MEKTKYSFFERAKIRSPGTQHNIKGAIDNFEKYYGDIDQKLAENTDIFELLQSWINKNHEAGLSPSTIYLYFINLKSFLYYKGIKLTKEDVKNELVFPKQFTEERYGLSVEQIQKILEVTPYKKRGLYLACISGGMRIGEACRIRKKDLDTSGKRIRINIPANITKTKKGRTTFISSEAAKYINLSKLEDDDRVWSRSTPENEMIQLGRYVEKAGLGMRYETTKRRKITSHSFRAYFITKLSRYDPNLAKKLAGQNNREDLLQYDRLTDEEKLDIYMEIEPELLINDTLKKDHLIKKLQSEQITAESIQNRLDQHEKEFKYYQMLAAVTQKFLNHFGVKFPQINGESYEVNEKEIESYIQANYPEYSEKKFKYDSKLDSIDE